MLLYIMFILLFSKPHNTAFPPASFAPLCMFEYYKMTSTSFLEFHSLLHFLVIGCGWLIACYIFFFLLSFVISLYFNFVVAVSKFENLRRKHMRSIRGIDQPSKFSRWRDRSVVEKNCCCRDSRWFVSTSG